MLKRSSGKTVALIPCYNGSITIGKVVDDFKRELPDVDIYAYDNNSKDGTGDIARAHETIMHIESRQGKGPVVHQMIRDIDADYYLLLDGDDTYLTEAAPTLLEPLTGNSADMTVGDHLSSGTYGEKNDRAFHDIGNDLVHMLIKWIYEYGFSDVTIGHRDFNEMFVKTMPITSPGFKIETELSRHTTDKRWRIAKIPIDYRDCPEGSKSKSNTFSDGFKILPMIASLFKDYKPLTLFGWLALLFCILGFVASVPIIAEFAATGLVPQPPSTLLAVTLVFIGILAPSCEFILNTVGKGTRKEYELQVTRACGNHRKHL